MASILLRRGAFAAAPAATSVLWRTTASSSIFSFLVPTLAVGLRINIPPIISEIWESILKAVPKKKQSHSRKRMRQLAGKALQDIKALNECPGCGSLKRSHHLCPTCVNEIKQMWKDGMGVGSSGTPTPSGPSVGDTKSSN
ncbi:hypothetical protein TWF106_001577 [Orbilia oligospora]|uniref:Large ribosomal subunit protein bL32m n=1 Tax=Orbilia oligospora TaxID=2813651 RepID=A0A6G1M203_ORBOL|nr:hypothetical protein TWF788_010192 [Orbilia oligospora]KAF3201474.1 hypothetical protein TWF679_011361 [Orbilia oligospora]KAF3204399.1 hypothetical protein TWF106_001577 [Orbilia oligospora]KAF3214299.1 hypothetical protein TWF191_009813 [Orbilia oligospora]KAF3241444.1 hypothetical protein TWF192_009182 [Orbilia oligospora]